MELLYAMLIIHPLSTCGGAILLDGGQSEAPAAAKLAGAYTRPLFGST